MKKPRLTNSITLSQFDNGYWYVDEIRDFAKSIGVPSTSRLRKDQLEKIIRTFLQTGKLRTGSGQLPPKKGTRDHDRGLSLSLLVIRYTNNRQTKDFILDEALKIRPGLKLKSGVRYRLNRWREAQISKGLPLTYRDIVRQFVKLNQVGGFAKIPHGRYINFLSDFMRNEIGATRKQGIKTWKALKKLDIPKDYKSWKKHKKGRSKDL